MEVTGKLSAVGQLPPAKCPRLSSDLDWTKCIFCQKKGKANDSLRNSTDEGINRVREASEIRQHYKSDRNTILFNVEHLSLSAKWHKNCYATFTSKEKLDRIKKQTFDINDNASKDSSPYLHTRSTQKSDPNWMSCLICGKQGNQLCQIQTFQAGEKLRHAAEKRNDQTVKLRLGDNDLIAF